MDEDTVSNDIVGIATIKMLSLIEDIDEWFEIQYKGKSAGKVHLVTQFTETPATLDQEADMSGKLKLTVVEAKLTRDTEAMFNKMDPFVTLKLREQNFKTKVLQGAGKTPKWDEVFDFDVKYIGDDL
jgi:Ca2+-dependent lipid-binding protein